MKATVAALTAQLEAIIAGRDVAALRAFVQAIPDPGEVSGEDLRRPGQMPPGGDWATWLLMAGRGFGKTYAGAMWTHDRAAAADLQRIAVIGATIADARGTMVEGVSGLLATARAGFRPSFEPSLRRLEWPNGSCATLFSGSEPEALRGPQFHWAWGDEAARWPRAEAAWSNLRLALRLGTRPRALLTTTPLPTVFLRRLIAAADTVTTGGRTADNAGNLAPGFVAEMTAAYGGTAIGRQELDGEIIDEVAGALWTRALLERCRVTHAPVAVRTVVGVDPPAGPNGTCGIVVACLGCDGLAAVLEDASVGGAEPERWARAVADAAERHAAACVVAEVNQGGTMVDAVLRGAAVGVPVKTVRASIGKSARAEPVAALYAAGRVNHVGAFPALEDELCGLLAGGGYAGPGRSPDRADALVWALSELMLGRSAGVRARGLG